MCVSMRALATAAFQYIDSIQRLGGTNSITSPPRDCAIDFSFLSAIHPAGIRLLQLGNAKFTLGSV